MVPLESKCPLKVTVTSSYQMSLLKNLKAVKLSSNDNVVSLISGDVSTVLLHSSADHPTDDTTPLGPLSGKD